MRSKVTRGFFPRTPSIGTKYVSVPPISTTSYQKLLESQDALLNRSISEIHR